MYHKIYQTVIFLFLSGYIFADSPKVLVVSDDLDKYFPGVEYLGIYEDRLQGLTINDVNKPEFYERFQTTSDSKKHPHISNLSSAYWVRLTIKCNGNTKKRWVLENLDLHTDFFELYVPEENGYRLYKAGYAQPFAMRLYPHKNFIFDIPIDSTDKIFYIRYISSLHNPFFIKIQSSIFFSYYSLNEYIVLGIFYGILIIMALYNLLLFLQIKEKVYLFYVGYVLLSMLVALEEDGLGFQYLWPDYPTVNKFIAVFLPLCLVYNFYWYSRNFLELPTNVPLLCRVLDNLMLVYAVFFLIDYLWLNLSWGLSFYIIPLLVIYIGAVLALIKGFRPARFYLVAYSFMLASIVLLILRMAGITYWSDLFSVYSYNIGLVFETVILSFAQADKLRIIKNESEQVQAERGVAQQGLIEQLQINEKLKDKVNAELEEKVKERTVELERQTQVIKRLNRLLKKQNIKLQDDVESITRSRVVQKVATFKEFSQIYSNDEACVKYLGEIKWKEGYGCNRCNNDSYSEGKSYLSKRCTKCGYDESATVNTLFHRLKFPLVKAFYIAYLVSNRKDFSVDEIAEVLQLRRQTCLDFKRKAEAMIANKKAPKNLEEEWGYLLLN